MKCYVSKWLLCTQKSCYDIACFEMSCYKLSCHKTACHWMSLHMAIKCHLIYHLKFEYECFFKYHLKCHLNTLFFFLFFFLMVEKCLPMWVHFQTDIFSLQIWSMYLWVAVRILGPVALVPSCEPESAGCCIWQAASPESNNYFLKDGIWPWE